MKLEGRCYNMVEHYYKKGDTINGLLIIKQIRIKTKKGKEKGYIVQSIAYPDAPPYEVREGNLMHGKGDAYLSGRRVYEGNSLYSYDEFKQFIVHPDKAKKVTKNSPKFLDFICPECKKIKSMRVYHLVNHGFSCSICSTGTSYPERFMLNYLEVKGIPFEYQVKLNNSPRRIDFKIYLGDVEYMVETHGSAHYDKSSSWFENTSESDIFKRQYCKDNGYILIELDCRESDFNFIKDNINSNKILPSINNEDSAKIYKLLSENKQYPTKLIVEDNEKGLNTKQISEKYGLTPRIVQSILKKSGVVITGHRKKVLCIETGIVYNSTQEASKITGVHQSSISLCCNGKQKTAGKLRWKYIV